MVESIATDEEIHNMQDDNADFPMVELNSVDPKTNDVV
eukprot:CAMPEP_0176369258 /NCGR_PEP_ID=MMETSP0126-20121128/23162_1 /TAXON_ID=141414 ORGANISM="Strombidinopsis acuminatum, Strain SPMC142" /NCGR_SAMPLE_ID=MMETSP0126 /ASSEMBLY_ACC=CAM_ASM_000229 /LENGTH=37 /DNA_ID= /DNA_START= /DNA_END= /DNA_ORIENTATION=